MQYFLHTLTASWNLLSFQGEFLKNTDAWFPPRGLLGCSPAIRITYSSLRNLEAMNSDSDQLQKLCLFSHKW